MTLQPEIIEFIFHQYYVNAIPEFTPVIRAFASAVSLN